MYESWTPKADYFQGRGDGKATPRKWPEVWGVAAPYPTLSFLPILSAAGNVMECDHTRTRQVFAHKDSRVKFGGAFHVGVEVCAHVQCSTYNHQQR